MCRVLLQRIPRHHLVRLTQPGDPLHLLHGKSARFVTTSRRKIVHAPMLSINHIISSELF